MRSARTAGVLGLVLAACSPSLPAPLNQVPGFKSSAQFNVRFTWPQGRPQTPPDLYVFATVEEDRPEPEEDKPLAFVGPLLYAPGVALDFQEIPNGKDRRVVVELRTGTTTEAPVRFYGVSPVFELQAGASTPVDVSVSMAPVPGSGNASSAVNVRSEDGYVRSSIVDVELRVQRGTSVELSNQLTFPTNGTVTRALTAAADLEQVATGDDGEVTWLLRGWDLDAGLATPCDNADGCSRTLYVRFHDAEGYVSETFQADVVVDTRIPSLVTGTAIDPVLVRSGVDVVVQLRASEMLRAPPVLSVVDSTAFTVEAPPDEPGTVFIYVVKPDADPSLAPDGDYALTAVLTDLANNASDSLPVAQGFTLDRAAPALDDPGVDWLQPAAASLGAQVTIRFNTTKALQELPVVSFNGDALAATATNLDDTWQHFELLHTVAAEDPQGLVTVTVQMRDRAGNVRTQALPELLQLDSLAPAASASVFPPVAKQGTVVTYSVYFTEEVAQVDGTTPSITAAHMLGDGTVETLAMGTPTTVDGFAYTWSLLVDGTTPEGEFGVMLEARDPAGNTLSTMLSVPIVIDRSAPDVRNVMITSTNTFTAAPPPRARQGDTVTIRFESNEDVDPASDRFDVIVGDIDLDAQHCARTALDAMDWQYTCTLDVTGPDDMTEGPKVVVIALQDEARNMGLGNGSVILDFTPPDVEDAVVQLQPGPGNPLPQVTKARVGTRVRVTAVANELVRFDTPMSAQLQARHTTVSNATVPFMLVGQPNPRGVGVVVGELEVPGSMPDGTWRVEVTWTDLAGNPVATALVTDAEFEVTNQRPCLVVDQSNVRFVRSPQGNGVSETLTGPGGTSSLPAGPFLALTSDEPLSSDPLLPAGTFTLSSGDSLTLLRVVGASDPSDTDGGVRDPDGGTPMRNLGLVQAVPDGGWPVQLYPQEDFKRVAVRGFDEAGNESAPVFLEHGELVVTSRPPPQSNLRHEVTLSATADAHPIMPEPDGTARIDGFTREELSASEGRAFIQKARLAWEALGTTVENLSPRAGHAMAYDAARGRVVLFGGRPLGAAATEGSTFDRELWEWDGRVWEKLFPRALDEFGPTGRADAAMAYDPILGRVVLFGGNTGSDLAPTYSDEVWAWDGERWALLGSTDGPGPSARAAAALVYEPRRRALLLFGGRDGTGLRNDLWVFEGHGWLPVSLGGNGSVPSPRSRHRVVHLAGSDTLLLTGGETGTGLVDEIWTFDTVASQWTRVVTPQGDAPPAMADHALVSVATPAGSRVLLYASAAQQGDSGSGAVWSYRNNTWTKLNLPIVSPTTELHLAAAFDVQHQEMVVLGSNALSNTEGARTFILDVATEQAWQERTGSRQTPPRRTGYAMAYDHRSRKVILHGGRGDDNRELSDTWVFDGSQWSRDLGVVSPGARSGHSMVFLEAADGTTPGVLLVGGFQAGVPQDSTWLYDGTRWAEVLAGTLPSARGYASLAVVNGSAVLFGGSRSEDFSIGMLQETLRWDPTGRQWLTLTNGGIVPSARADAVLAGDPTGSRALLFGGVGAGGAIAADTYTLSVSGSGAMWTLVPGGIVAGPSGRRGAAMVYAPERARFVMLGGVAREYTIAIPGIDGTASSAAPRETWEFDPSSNGWSRQGIEPASTPSLQEGLLFAVPGGVQVMGFDGSDGKLRGWALDARHARVPGAQLVAMLGTTGIPGPQAVQGLRARARVGGTGAGGVMGARLHAWHVDGSAGLQPWSFAPIGPANTQPAVGALNGPGALLDVTLPTPGAFLSGAPGTEQQLFVAIQARPAGVSGDATLVDGAQLAVDFLELRVRYQLPAVGGGTCQ